MQQKRELYEFLLMLTALALGSVQLLFCAINVGCLTSNLLVGFGT